MSARQQTAAVWVQQCVSRFRNFRNEHTAQVALYVLTKQLDVDLLKSVYAAELVKFVVNLVEN